MSRAEVVTRTGKKDARTRTTLSWDLVLWKKRGARSRLELFEEMILPHLNAAHNLARWLTRNDQDAQDVVQEAYLRAFRFFDGFKGGDGKAWLLAIVRNTCRTWRRQSLDTGTVPFDEFVHSAGGRAGEQEQSVIEGEKIGVLRSCIEKLPVGFREILVMRELEEMSYQQIAEVAGVALGTVMSRLSRARQRLEECAANRTMEAAR